MSDYIGIVPVPATATATSLGTPVSGVNLFPLYSDWGFSTTIKRNVVTHTFGSLDAKITQRFYTGDGATRYLFRASTLTNNEAATLRTFWLSMQGGNAGFYYNAPNEDGTSTQVIVRFENTPLSLQQLTNSICSTGVTFVQIPQGATPSYTVDETVLRYPQNSVTTPAMTTNLLSQVQTIIPLVKITVLDPTYNGGGSNQFIYLSDRRITIGGITYLPRLLRIGSPGSEVLFTQSIGENTPSPEDDMTLTFGNADRCMVKFANSTQLRNSNVQLSLFRVNTTTGTSGTVLNLWAGYVMDWHSDSGPEFTLQMSDILAALTRTSPVSNVSRTCWRRYSLDGCPATMGSQALDLVNFTAYNATTNPSGANASTCDQGYNTPNGCMAHSGGANPTETYYGATYCSPQGVLLRSGNLGVAVANTLITPLALASLLGFGINASTWHAHTSVISDSVFSKTIPEIWHNDDGVPQYGLPVPCKIVTGRDETQFYIALGIVGKGPLGVFTPPQMWDSQTGITGDTGVKDTFLGSTLDGQPNHGFQVDSNGNLKSGISGVQALYGLRQTLGGDPAGAHDYFSLGRVTGEGSRPQGWYTKSSDGTKMYEVEYPVWDGVSADTTSSYDQVFSAGVAACEIRIIQTGKEPVSSPDQHNMVASISQGLSANVWTPSSSAAVSPFSITEVDPALPIVGSNYTCLNVWVNSATSIGALAVGYTVTISGCSTSALNVSGTVKAVFATGSGVDGTLIQIMGVSIPTTTVYGLGGTMTPTPAPSGALYQVPGCTNPFWVAINTYLRSLGVLGLSSSAQTAFFDQNSAVSCAAIADLIVPQIIGTGNETQFRFKGIIDDRKATRDWLQAILASGLGYFVWSFGKLKVGCKENASAVASFSSGNMLFNSLQMEPLKPTFEQMTATFNDQDYQYQQNSVVYIDQPYAARNNRIQNPLAKTLPISGATSKSAAGRIIATRTREELGGVQQSEQDIARIATWKTTIASLDTEAGMVCGITDPEIPGLIGTCTVTGSSSTWTATNVSGNVWTAPGTPTVGDTSLVGKAILIGGTQVIISAVASNGSTLTASTVTATTPPTGTVAFQVITMNFRAISWSLNKDWSVTIRGKTVTPSMYNLLYGPKPQDVKASTPPSRPPSVWVPTYEPSYTVSGSIDPLYPNAGFGVVLGYIPANGTISPQVTLYGLTPAYSAGLTFVARREFVSGICSQQASSVTTVDSTHGNIVFGPGATGTGAGFTNASYVGKIISKIANAIGSTRTVPIQDFTITAANLSTGTFTCTPDPAVAGGGIGDLYTIRTGYSAAWVAAGGTPASPLVVTATSIEDPCFLNPYNSTGLTVNGNKGNILLVVGGTGAFQSPQVDTGCSDGMTTTLYPGWDTGKTPDSTSQFVIVEAAPQATLSIDGSLAGNADSSLGILSLPSYMNQVVRIEGYISGNLVGLQQVPFRELYTWGPQDRYITSATASPTMLLTDCNGTVLINAAGGNINYLCLAAAMVPNLRFTWRRTDTVTANTVTITAATNELFSNGLSTMTLTPSSPSATVVYGSS